MQHIQVFNPHHLAEHTIYITISLNYTALTYSVYSNTYCMKYLTNYWIISIKSILLWFVKDTKDLNCLEEDLELFWSCQSFPRLSIFPSQFHWFCPSRENYCLIWSSIAPTTFPNVFIKKHILLSQLSSGTLYTLGAPGISTPLYKCLLHTIIT